MAITSIQYSLLVYFQHISFVTFSDYKGLEKAENLSYISTINNKKTPHK